MNEQQDDAPKIIIDSDWKSQAQAEKERMAQEEAAAAESGGGQGGPQELPPADFRTLLGTIATQAIMYLGGMAHPETQQPIVDLEYSKHQIDLLAVLQEKTKGNLSDEESQELSGVLNELRMRWVEINRMVGEQIAKQQAAGGPQPPSGGAG